MPLMGLFKEESPEVYEALKIIESNDWLLVWDIGGIAKSLVKVKLTSHNTAVILDSKLKPTKKSIRIGDAGSYSVGIVAELKTLFRKYPKQFNELLQLTKDINKKKVSSLIKTRKKSSLYTM